MVAVLSIFGVSSILGNDDCDDCDDFGGECTRDAEEKSVCAFDTMVKQRSEEKREKNHKNRTANTGQSRSFSLCDSVMLRAKADPFGTCGDI